MKINENRSCYRRLPRLAAVLCGFTFAICTLMWSTPAHAAGTLTPKGSAHQPIKIQDHHVEVIINSGFAKTEVTQTFQNPNSQDLEGIYSFPVPESASLSEFSIYVGETEINGEIVPKEKARTIYEEEKSKGNDAGLATKDKYKTFEFAVARIPANDEVRIRFVYYQPIQVDTGVGRFVYPLEDGGTDEVATNFWTANSVVESSFSAQIDVRMGYPIEDLRMPGFEAATTVEDVAEGHKRITLAAAGGSLSKDLVLYYRLAQDLPARLELLTYKADASKPGTFMLIATPGLDLQPLAQTGSDYVFILDVSGSMAGKLHTLTQGVRKALGELSPQDRFRIVAFQSYATDVSNGWEVATAENVNKMLTRIDSLQANGSTNLYEGISLGLQDLDADRVTSVILVTDGVTNTGIVDPKDFEQMLSQYDIRMFGFLMGNSANWPLMRVITETTGGYYSGVSNTDDIIGQIMLAKSKVLFESVHDAELSIRGVKTFDTTDEHIGKVYRGEQLVMFGRYDSAGTAKVKLAAKLSGQDKTYETSVVFPETATDFPELERLWALNRIEQIETDHMLGKLQDSEAKKAVEGLGVQYQLVTDETSMLVLSDQVFSQHGIERRNQQRVSVERAAQTQRYSQPVRNRRADQHKPMFNKRRAPHISLGGGAIDPLTGGFGLLLSSLLGGLAIRRKKPGIPEKNTK